MPTEEVRQQRPRSVRHMRPTRLRRSARRRPEPVRLRRRAGHGRRPRSPRRHRRAGRQAPRGRCRAIRDRESDDRDGAVPDLPDRRRGRRGEFVETVVAAEEQHVDGPALPLPGANTSAITGAIRGLPQPIALAAGWAGLVSGPRKLKTVGMPSSRRGGTGVPVGRVVDRREAEPDADLGDGASRPRLRAARWRTPSPSSRSAAPHLLDAARLPCLTTGAPAPAMTMAAIVEMLTVLARSPPVPTMSTARSGTCTRTACASMLSARPVTSDAVSPLARSATAKPANCAGVASPLMIRSITQPVSATSRCSLSSNLVSRVGQDRSDVTAVGGR